MDLYCANNKSRIINFKNKYIMKTTVISILTVFFLSTGFVNTVAASKEKVEKQVENMIIKNAIEKSVQYPHYAKEEGIQGYVNVIFSVTREGHIDIKASSSNESLLREHVVKSMENTSLKDYDFNTDEIYSIKLNFRLL